jgi:hypothetical protein
MVEDVLAGYSSLVTSGMSVAEDAAGSAEEKKVMVCHFHYAAGAVALYAVKIDYGLPPERRPKTEGFRITLKDPNGNKLTDFMIRDPRYKDFAENPPGGERLKEVDFSVALPFFELGKTLVVSVSTTGAVLGSFDIALFARTFCAEYPDDPSCRCDGDMDEDRDVDGLDLWMFAYKYAGNSQVADLNQDQSIDEDDVALFARKFGREDCPDLDPPNCSDGNLCTLDFFDPVSKTCVHREKSCYDGSPCTQDLCNTQTGACMYIAKRCDDGNPCTVDSCDTITGQCLYKPVRCDDGNACTSDFCNPQTGQCVHKTLTCNDGNLCTDDLCDPVAGCFHVRKSCDDGDPCTIDACDPKTGGCLHVRDTTCQACCGAFGQCSDLPVKLCQELKGTPMGTGTTCAKVQCPK